VDLKVVVLHLGHSNKLILTQKGKTCLII
jgi:hypothetical protein